MFVDRSTSGILQLYTRPPWGSVGDLLMATPAIDVFKKRFPNSKVIVDAESWQSRALYKNPLIDELHNLCFKVPAKIREQDQGWDTRQHPVRQIMQKAGLVIDTDTDLQIKIFSDDKDAQVVLDWMYEQKLEEKRFAIFAVHNSWLIRSEIVRAIILQLLKRDLTPVMIGQAAEAYIKMNSDCSMILADDQRIGWRVTHLKELIRRASLFISMDAGSAQIAAATDADMIVIYSTNAPETRCPLRKNGFFIPVQAHNCPCQDHPCHRAPTDMVPNCQNTSNPLACIQSIEPRHIDEAFDQLYALRGAAGCPSSTKS